MPDPSGSTGGAARAPQELIALERRGSGECRVLVDGVFFQLARTGIARVWESILQEWSRTDFARQVTVLDRGKTPRYAGFRYRQLPPFRFADTTAIAAESRILQDTCDDERAAVFVSTYYTFPAGTPSVFLCHDMIPEKLGYDLNQPMWRLKHLGIRHAASFVCVSENTARDLKQFLGPDDARTITVAHNGVQPSFRRAPPEEVQGLLPMLRITQPYFLLVGVNHCGSYKNPELFFDALTLLPGGDQCQVLCTGAAASQLLEEVRERYPRIADRVVAAQLSQRGLVAAYSGAMALIVPSRYEGFGLPVLEAMACQCPVVACPVGSIPEIAGDLVAYVDPDDPRGLSDVMGDFLRMRRHSIVDPSLEQRLQLGRMRAEKFSWQASALNLRAALLKTAVPVE